MDNRNLDGLYFRVERNGKWRNICFSDLTPEERYENMKDKDKEWLKSTCDYLADRIREIGDHFDIIGGVDIEYDEDE